MTVKELIQQLERLPADSQIYRFAGTHGTFATWEEANPISSINSYEAIPRPNAMQLVDKVWGTTDETTTILVIE